jgi:hypothetical protein
MTEYDYSPEAYDRYLATQRRIANWVDQTEHHRPQFGPTTQSVADFSNSRTKHHRRYYRPPPSDSGSDDSYAAGPGYPGPMPGPMHMHNPPPPLMYPQQPIYQPMVPPLISPGYTFPPTSPHYYPDHHRSSRSHRSRHSQSSRHSAFHFASPPTSPIYPHGYPPPPMVRYPPQGFVMMPPPPPLPRGRKMSVMVSLTAFLHLLPASIILTLRHFSFAVSLNYLFLPTPSKSLSLLKNRLLHKTAPIYYLINWYLPRVCFRDKAQLVSSHRNGPPRLPHTLCLLRLAVQRLSLRQARAQQSSAALHVLPRNLPLQTYINGCMIHMESITFAEALARISSFLFK